MPIVLLLSTYRPELLMARELSAFAVAPPIPTKGIIRRLRKRQPPPRRVAGWLNANDAEPHPQVFGQKRLSPVFEETLNFSAFSLDQFKAHAQSVSGSRFHPSLA